MIKFILLYYLVGIGIYLVIWNLYDMWGKKQPPHILVAAFWPIVFILAFNDLVGWLIKGVRRDE